MNIYLVTGGAGFIGSTFVRALMDRGDGVVVLDALTYSGRAENLDDLADAPYFEFVRGDICDSDLVSSLLEKFTPRAVVNLAAESHVDRSIDWPESFVRTNVVGVHALLKSSLAYWRGLSAPGKDAFRFVQVSTDEVYGSVDEGEADEGAAFNPSSPYSASKASGDMLARAYFHTYGLPVVITHGCNSYGPRQFPEKLIPLMILRALSDMSLPLFGDGSNVREWIHVDDHAHGVLKALDDGRLGHAYNLGSTYRLPNLEIANILCSLLDELAPSSERGSYRELIEFVPDRPGHDLRYAMNSSKARDDLGWAPSVEFREGLASTVEWYAANRQWWLPITRDDYRLDRLGSGEAVR